MSDLALPYFLARPAGAAPRAGVVVIHEGNGISPQLLRFCQRLAAEGYVAVAPDLFFRAGGTEAADFSTLIGSLDADRTRRDIEEAAGVARSIGAARVGITGFCMGGRLTYSSALHSPVFDAAVGFYGGGIAGELGNPRCPTLLLFGGSDQWIPASDIEAVVAHHPETVVYPDAGHGFMRDGSDSFHREAAADGWSRLLGFFATHLG